MLLASVLLILGQATAAPERLHRACLPVDVASSESPGEAGERVPSFSPLRDRELRITARVRGLSGQHTLYLKVFTPRGYLYQTFAIPFTTPGAPPGTRSPRPIAEVTARLPVRGTMIMTSGLYGKWRVEPWLDGGSASCGSPRAFVIVE